MSWLDGRQVSYKSEDIAEDEYIRTFMRWEHTPKWNVLARWLRKREYELWLRCLTREVQRKYG